MDIKYFIILLLIIYFVTSLFSWQAPYKVKDKDAQNNFEQISNQMLDKNTYDTDNNGIVDNVDNGVTTNTNQTITGQKTFSSTVTFEGNIIIDTMDLKTDVSEKIVDYIFTSSATSISFTSLNGDVDEIYYISGRIVVGQNTSIMSITFNGDTTDGNYQYQILTGNGASATSSQDAGDPSIIMESATLNSNHLLTFNGVIYSRTGYSRSVLIDSGGLNPGSLVTTDQISGIWINTTDNLSSIEFKSSVTNGIGINSHIVIYKKRK